MRCKNNGGYCCYSHGTPTGYLLSDDEKYVCAVLSSHLIYCRRVQYIQGHVLSLGKKVFFLSLRHNLKF